MIIRQRCAGEGPILPACESSGRQRQSTLMMAYRRIQPISSGEAANEGKCSSKCRNFRVLLGPSSTWWLAHRRQLPA
jgi:hypothetical protein